MEVVELTRDLIGYDSVSRHSNAPLMDYLETQLKEIGCEVERIAYTDPEGVLKVSLVARKGPSTGEGFALMGHCDTVPADDWETNPFEAKVRDGKLYGRGSCDMKGAVAAMLVAASRYQAHEFESPLYLLLTSDEEIGCLGARAITEQSRLFRDAVIPYGLIGEPTLLEVVHAHKGVVLFTASAEGKAAHSSTGKGINANLQMIPFLMEMKHMHDWITTDPQFRNPQFDPPYPIWNIVLSDGETAVNVTAPRSTCRIGFRPMPGMDVEAVIEQVERHAHTHGIQLDVWRVGEPLMTPVNSPIVQRALEITGKPYPITVPYGTDGVVFGSHIELVILGPGSIQQAHTVDEWIALDQLHQAVNVYQRFIETFCVEPVPVQSSPMRGKDRNLGTQTN